MGVWNWLAAAAIILSPWRRKIWPLAVFAILADPESINPWSDPEALRLIEEYRKKYLEMGYPRQIVDIAIKWAVDLAERMFNKLFPNIKGPEARRIFLDMLRKYLEWAADYIAGMAGAATEIEARLAAAKARELGEIPRSVTGARTVSAVA